MCLKFVKNFKGETKLKMSIYPFFVSTYCNPYHSANLIVENVAHPYLKLCYESKY